MKAPDKWFEEGNKPIMKQIVSVCFVFLFISVLFSRECLCTYVQLVPQDGSATAGCIMLYNSETYDICCTTCIETCPKQIEPCPENVEANSADSSGSTDGDSETSTDNGIPNDVDRIDTKVLRRRRSIRSHIYSYEGPSRRNSDVEKKTEDTFDERARNMNDFLRKSDDPWEELKRDQTPKMYYRDRRVTYGHLDDWLDDDNIAKRNIKSDQDNTLISRVLRDLFSNKGQYKTERSLSSRRRRRRKYKGKIKHRKHGSESSDSSDDKRDSIFDLLKRTTGQDAHHTDEAGDNAQETEAETKSDTDSSDSSDVSTSAPSDNVKLMARDGSGETHSDDTDDEAVNSEDSESVLEHMNQFRHLRDYGAKFFKREDEDRDSDSEEDLHDSHDEEDEGNESSGTTDGHERRKRLPAGYYHIPATRGSEINDYFKRAVKMRFENKIQRRQRRTDDDKTGSGSVEDTDTEEDKSNINDNSDGVNELEQREVSEDIDSEENESEELSEIIEEGDSEGKESSGDEDIEKRYVENKNPVGTVTRQRNVLSSSTESTEDQQDLLHLRFLRNYRAAIRKRESHEDHDSLSAHSEENSGEGNTSTIESSEDVNDQSVRVHAAYMNNKPKGRSYPSVRSRMWF